MPDFFLLQLDTTAPEITWGSVAGAQAGEDFSIDYTIDEPEIIAAELVDANDVHYPLTVGPTSITVTLPGSAADGPAQVIVQVKDEVDNEALRTFGLSLGAPTPVDSGGGHAFTHGPVEVRTEFVFPASVTLRRVSARDFTFASTISASRHFESRLAFTASSRRVTQFTFEAVRESAPHYTALLREDEELLLSL